MTVTRFTVVYDASVLYPAPLRDLLLHLAATDLFRARWTDRIHDEWTGALLEKRPDLTPERLVRTRRLMDAAVPDCLVTDFDSLVSEVELPDPDDRHVLAAARRCGAEIIVTMNLTDFPDSVLAPHGIAAQDPDSFVANLIESNAAIVLDAVRRHRSSLRQPPKTADEYLATLLRQGLHRAVHLLRGFFESI